MIMMMMMKIAAEVPTLSYLPCVVFLGGCLLLWCGGFLLLCVTQEYGTIHLA